jgi:HlyD family secretion protein
VFEKRLVKTGLSDGINIEVLSGLEADTKIKKRS